MPECPICGLTNPPSAEVCDCGHRFVGIEYDYRPTPKIEVKTVTYVKTLGTYMWNGKTMDEHVALMMREGWELATSSADHGHINLGRTVAGAVLTGGLSLLLGGSRSSPEMTLTFKRVR